MRAKLNATAFAILLAVATPSHAVVIDRVAAVVEEQVITLSELNQVIQLKIFERKPSETDDIYRRRILEFLIEQTLRFRDVERFGGFKDEDVSKDSIEARLREAVGRFSSQAAFDEALRKSELTLDEVRAVIKRQLQVEAYIEERFSAMIFVSLEEIENHYRQFWAPQRASRGLPPVSLSEAREDIRNVLRAERLGKEILTWTAQLRSRANVDVFAWR